MTSRVWARAKRALLQTGTAATWVHPGALTAIPAALLFVAAGNHVAEINDMRAALFKVGGQLLAEKVLKMEEPPPEIFPKDEVLERQFEAEKQAERRKVVHGSGGVPGESADNADGEPVHRSVAAPKPKKPVVKHRTPMPIARPPSVDDIYEHLYDEPYGEDDR